MEKQDDDMDTQDNYEKGPFENYPNCGCLKDSIGKEQALIEALDATANDGPWIGFVHDCHSAVKRALESQGFVFPGSPNGRWSRK
jgi:hypothetical protein